MLDYPHFTVAFRPDRHVGCQIIWRSIATLFGVRDVGPHPGWQLVRRVGVVTRVPSLDERLAVLSPHLHDAVPLSVAAKKAGVPLRTAQRWLIQLPGRWRGRVGAVRAD